jgi:hypothetical protein
MTTCGGVSGSSATVYGSGPHDVRLAAYERDERQRRLVLDAQRPRRAQQGPQQERVARTRSVEQVGERVHRDSVDART